VTLVASRKKWDDPEIIAESQNYLAWARKMHPSSADREAARIALRQIAWAELRSAAISGRLSLYCETFDTEIIELTQPPLKLDDLVFGGEAPPPGCSLLLHLFEEEERTVTLAAPPPAAPPAEGASVFVLFEEEEGKTRVLPPRRLADGVVTLRAADLERILSPVDSGATGTPPAPRFPAGRPEVHDVAVFFEEVTWFLYFNGLPEKQATLINEVLDAYSERLPDKPLPSSDWAKKKIRPLWNRFKSTGE
jgi:hypothetical protein